MASIIPRDRRSGPVARFNTFEELDNEIKAQIGHASHAQRALLKNRPLWHPVPTRVAEPQPGQLHRNSRSFDGSSSESHHALSPEPAPLERMFSFNSLSTLQRENEAARQLQWRDSPVSAYMPSDRTAPYVIDQKIELEDRCPPMTVYTLKQMRKDQKEDRKSLKKRERADRLAAHRRRASEVQIFPPTSNTDDEKPKRAISDPSSFKVSTAIQLVKKLTTTKSRLIGKRPKKDEAATPSLDDFHSKTELREYLNPSLPESTTEIAELPGSPLPPYTLFQDATCNEGNIPCSDLEPVGGSPVCRSRSNPERCDGRGNSRMMRCDLCQFGIKLDEQYFHCSICNNGDRIVCNACDASGLSCRHELTERVRRVLRYDDENRQRSASRPRRRQTAPTTVDESYKTSSQPSSTSPIDSRSVTSAHHNALDQLKEKQHQLDLKELAMRKREQDLSWRERETALKEREAQLRIREAEADSKARQQEATNRDLISQFAEMVNLGAQFVRSSSQKSSASASEDDILTNVDAESIRQHAAKRKSSAGRSSSAIKKKPARSENVNAQQSPRRPPPEDDEDDDEDTGSGTPKRPKLDTASALGEVLYACHFCKFNSRRFSERNNSEKQYRGCSSGYWPDISRLKQHLYRVHWRSKHCPRCYQTFKSDDELNHHLRQNTACTMRPCPFPEKFDDEKYNEIKRKRPNSSPEEVWFIIYETLFPGCPRPASPYADGGADTGPDSASSPSSSTQQTLEAACRMFASRLGQRQDEWLQQPGARETIIELMQDVMRSMAPLSVNSPPADIQRERPPIAAASLERPLLHPLQVPTSGHNSVAPSPEPLSATSTHSTASAHWLLPSYRRSFSRPFRHSEEITKVPTLISATNTTPSEVIFRMPTPVNVEDDQYDDESHSWQQGDEDFAMAMAAPDNFDFDFPSQEGLNLAPTVPPTDLDKRAYSPPRILSAPAFKPVKVASLADHPSAAAAVETFINPTLSNASADSGYDSSSSRPTSSAPNHDTRSRMKGCNKPALHSQMSGRESVADADIDMNALNIDFGAFTGAEHMDEFGNVGNRSLTDYLYQP